MTAEETEETEETEEIEETAATELVQPVQRAYVPKIYVARFFQLITVRQFAEAERVLDRIKQKIKMNERNSGYFQALTGMLMVKKSNNDRYAFLANYSFSDKKDILNYRREFLKQSEDRLNADYDKGFFSAWADYMRILSKLELPPAQQPTNVQKQPEVKEEPKAAKPEPEAEETAEEETTDPEGQDAEDAETVEPKQSSLEEFSS